MSLNSIETFLNKIGNPDMSISSRAISNLEIKINLQTIKFDEVTFYNLNKLIIELIDWMKKNSEPSNIQFTIKALYIIYISFDYINEQIWINLRAKNFSEFIQNLCKFCTSNNLMEICEKVSRKFVSMENNFRNNENNNIDKNIEFEEYKAFNFNILNSEKKNNDSINKNYEFSQNLLNDNKNDINGNSYLKLSENNLNSNINMSINNSKNKLNFLPNNRLEKINTDFINKGTLYPAKNYNTDNTIIKEYQDISKNFPNSPINRIPCFPIISISKNDEQIFYDININMKFGDSLQINKTLNKIYFYLLEEYPIEYFLQNAQILKSILILSEKCNHLEYGQILCKIINKVITLLEKKINFFENNLSKKFYSLKKEEEDNKMIIYPNCLNNNSNEKPLENKNLNLEECLSIRDYLILTIDALIISLKNPEKISFYLTLIQKYFNLLMKLFIDIDKEWTIIFQNIIRNIYLIIVEYKKNKINFDILNMTLIQFVLEFNDFSFIKIFEKTDIFYYLKEILFIFNDYKSNLNKLLLEKIKKVCIKIEEKNLKTDLLVKLKELVIHNEKAEIIKSSIEISKRISKLSLNKIKEGETKRIFSIEDVNFINENFNNILITYKYFIDINDENFVKKIQIRIKNHEKEDFLNNKFQQNNILQNFEKEMIRKNFDNEIENIHKNSHSEYFNFFEFIGVAYNFINLNENYFKDVNKGILIERNNDLNLENNNNMILDNFKNLISLLNTLDGNNIFKYSSYIDFLNELKSNEFNNSNFKNDYRNEIINNNNIIKNYNFLLLINSKPNILLGIFNDLSNSIEQKNKKLEIIIVDILQIILSNALILDENSLNRKNNFSIHNNIFNFSLLFPIQQKNMRFLSLNSRLEKKLSPDKKLLKYMRLLFSTSENLRLNAIHFFKNLFNLNSKKNNLKENEIEFIEFSSNYEKLKKLDLIYSIQTADNEYSNIFNTIISEDIEFYPLWNILQSKKLDLNLKSSAIDQLINLTFSKKYQDIFCNEIILYIENTIISIFSNYRINLENYLVYEKSTYNNKNNNNYIEKYSQFNNFLDEFYLDKNLNFISALFKLMNFIVLNNSDDERIINFMSIRNNKNLFDILHNIIIQLFPNDNVEILLNNELKKNRSKHMLSVNLIYFVFLAVFNLKNSFEENITDFYFFDNKSNENILLKTYSFIEINKSIYVNLCPIKDTVKFSINVLNEYNIRKNYLDCKDYFKMDKHIIEFIKYKGIYSNLNNQINEKNEGTDILQNLIDPNLIKNNIKKLLQDFHTEQNYLDLFLNISKIFEYFIMDIHIRKKNSENIEKNGIKLFSDLNKFEERESKILVQILSFIKTVIPNSLEEKNILIDILNSIKIFLNFLKENFYLYNFKEKNLKEEKIEINILNYKEKLQKISSKYNENKMCLYLPLFQKGLNDAVNNYLNFICNSKIFIKNVSINLENQIFLLELFELILIFPELFDSEFYSQNFEAFIFIIKIFLNSSYDCENLYLIRLQVTKFAIKLFEHMGCLKERHQERYKKFETFLIENNEFFEILIDSIEYFIGNFKDEKLKKYREFCFKKKNQFENIENLGINFKEMSLLKYNIILLNEVIKNYDNEDLHEFIINKSNIFSYLYLDLLDSLQSDKYYQENINDEENIIYIDIIILSINIFEKIKFPNQQILLLRNKPNFIILLFKILLNTNSPSILSLKICDLLVSLIENFIKNSYIIINKNNNILPNSNKNFSQRLNFSGNNESEMEKSNFNISNLNPNFENIEENEDYDNFGKISSKNFHKRDEIELIIEEIFEKNSEIFDVSNILLLINLIKKNIRNTFIVSNLFNLNKKIIEFFDLKNILENFGKKSNSNNNISNSKNFFLDNDNKNYIFDQILNSAYLEIQKDIIKYHIDKLEQNIIILKSNDSNNLLNIYKKLEKGINILDQENVKLLKIQEIFEIIILINEIIGIFRNLLMKNSDISRNFKENKNFIIENINYLMKFMFNFNQILLIFKISEFVLFCQYNNIYVEVFYNLINNFFSLLHSLYSFDTSIINEELLEISFYVKNVLIDSSRYIGNNNDEIETNMNSKKEFDDLKEIKINKIFEYSDKLKNVENIKNLNEVKCENKIKSLIDLCYELLIFELNKNNFSSKVYFSKILPFLIDTVIYYNKILRDESNKYSNSENLISNNMVHLTNEGDTIMHLIKGIKEIYSIKYDIYDSKINYKFQMKSDLLNEKNSLVCAISSILCVSQTAKKIFVKSSFINIFLDYIRQLSECLLDNNLEFGERNQKLFLNNIHGKKLSIENDNFNDITQITEKNYYFEYLISEYNSILMLLKNLFFSFDDCDEKTSLFLSFEYFDENMITNFVNYNNNNKELEGKKNILKKKSVNTSYASNSNSTTSNNKGNISKIKKISKISQNEKKLINENKKVNMDNSTINFSSDEKSNDNNVSFAKNFILVIFDIFNDSLKFNCLFEEYFKMLINIISSNDYAKKSLILSINNPEMLGKKDSFLIVLLEFLQKKFLCGGFNFDKNLNNSKLFINLLKSLFLNKQIVLFLIKIKFIENFKIDLINLLQNKKFFTNKNNQICLSYLLELLISLSFDTEVRKKIADKETIEILTNSLLKIKNEEIWYNLLFVLRNISFANQNKNFFLVNEELLGTIFAFLSSGEKSVRVKFMISHLIWILVYNNQGLKSILIKEVFRTELISMQLHLQKEFDMMKYMKNDTEKKEENKEDEIYRYQLEQACLNFKKILHIIEH